LLDGRRDKIALCATSGEWAYEQNACSDGRAGLGDAGVGILQRPSTDLTDKRDHKQPTDEQQYCQCARRDDGHSDNEPATNKQPKPHHRRDLHRGNDRDILQRAERPQHEWLRIARRIWIGQRDRLERRIGIDRWFGIGCGERRRCRQYIFHPGLRRLSNGQRVVQLICNCSDESSIVSDPPDPCCRFTERGYLASEARDQRVSPVLESAPPAHAGR
jgi:hypothetical protein